MMLIDRLCAAALFLLALVDSLLVPRTYTGRIWIFGTCLALVFNAMLNVLRIRNPAGLGRVRQFSIIANLVMLAFASALIASIGTTRMLRNPMVPLATGLLLLETVFSLSRRA